MSSGSVTRAFTVKNRGSGFLTLGLAQVSGRQAGDFTVTSDPQISESHPSIPDADGARITLKPGEATTFEVKFDPSAVGVRTATIIIGANDADESLFNFDIRGIGR